MDKVVDHEILAMQNATLRDANQNLLLATLDADDMRSRAESAQARQNEFLSMLAHELRNPLAPIGMAAALLGRLSEPTAQMLHIKDIIDRQVAHLSRLLDDLLDVARISNGKITLTLQPLAIAVELANAVEALQPRLKERFQHIALNLATGEASGALVDGDPVRLAQVFSNLLVNASKFTQDGGQLAVSMVLDGDSVIIKFDDNGAGIATDVLPHVFTLFAQGPRTNARTEGGIGVGLNIVQQVMRLHGGSVSAASAGLGRGACFTLKLPRMAGTLPPARAQAQARPASPSQRILVIEDNFDAGDMLELVLSSEGHTVVVAPDGISGLAQACRGVFDIVLCDLGLPGIDGFSVMRTLRETLDGQLPFCVAISGYGQPEDRERAASAGFDSHLVKPIDVDVLLEMIAAAPFRYRGAQGAR